MMIFEGAFEFRTSTEKLWGFLTSPARIGKCLPDLKTLEVEGEDRFVALIRVGVGPIRTDFKFRIRIVGKEPISRVRLEAIGAGSGSSIIIDMAIELKEIPGGSQLLYRSDVKVAGRMASLGQRVTRDTVEKTVAGVFECVKKQVE